MTGPEAGTRIERLLEAKKVGERSGQHSDMIQVQYTADDTGQENVVVHINSFVDVVSVSYLLEISYFFIPEDLPDGWMVSLFPVSLSMTRPMWT